MTSQVSFKKAKTPGAQFFICLPLADNERLSEVFVCAKYDRYTAIINFQMRVSTS
jgi:hypothetical protein